MYHTALPKPLFAGEGFGGNLDHPFRRAFFERPVFVDVLFEKDREEDDEIDVARLFVSEDISKLM